MQDWRRLKQSIPGAGENVARSQVILSRPLLAGFRKDRGEQPGQLPAIGEAAKEAKAVIFGFYTPQLLCPDSSLL